MPKLRTKTEGNFNTREAAEARLKELEEKKLITRNGWNIVMTWKQYKQIKELMKDQINEMGE